MSTLCITGKLDWKDALFTLPDTDTDAHLGTDIHPKNGTVIGGSGPGLESESEHVQWEQFLYSTM